MGQIANNNNDRPVVGWEPHTDRTQGGTTTRAQPGIRAKAEPTTGYRTPTTKYDTAVANATTISQGPPNCQPRR